MITIRQLHELPKTSGIYRVVDAQGITLYVGQAKNIHHRWKNGHHKLAEIIAICGVDACITWVEIPEWLLNRAENAAVFAYKPQLNAKTPPIV
jgi:excinuclease UvrABC nuclease subunit